MNVPEITVPFAFWTENSEIFAQMDRAQCFVGV